MRRVLSPILVVGGLAGLSLGLAGAVLVLPAEPALAAGKKVCTVTDDRLVELSGIIATESGFVVVNDSSDSASAERVFFLDKKCKIQEEVRYGGNGPRDPEDLALSADGKTIWIADIGDNVTSAERRSSVVLWSMPANGSAQPVLHRLTYPGGRPHDAEALLIGADGTPYIITKTTGTAEIYRPMAALQKNNARGVPMEKAGEITLPKTTTANTFGPTGRVTITGAASSPDGTRITLRTYADAFEWDVVDGDIVKTLTTGEPRPTALSDPFGEAITYTQDGKTFLTVSDVASLGDDAAVEILSYPPAQKAVVAAEGGGQAAGASSSWLDGLTLDDITYLIAAVGLLGAALVGAGIFGIVRARRRPPDPDDAAAGNDDDGTGPGPGRRAAVPGWSDDEAEAPVRGNTYGADDSGWRPPGGGNGFRPAAAPEEYEPSPGRRAGGAVYGSRPAAPSGGRPPVPPGGRPPAPAGGRPPVPPGGRPPAAAPSGGAVYGSGGPSTRKPASGGVYGGGPAASGPPPGGRDVPPSGRGGRDAPPSGGGAYGGGGGSRGGYGSGGGDGRDQDGPSTGNGYQRQSRAPDHDDERDVPQGRARTGNHPNDYGYR